MSSPALKQRPLDEADQYPDETNRPPKETLMPEIVPPVSSTMKVTDRKRWPANDSRPRSRRSTGAVDRLQEIEFFDSRVSVLDEVDRLALGTPVFVFHIPGSFDVTSDIGRNADGENYGVIQDLQKSRKLRPRNLLWASLICFGIAASFLLALIEQLS